MMTTEYLSVGQIAKRCGVKVSTLHFYEEKGLITSWRNEGNQRRYERHIIRRVSLIKVAQGLGFSLQDISEVFARLPDGRTPSVKDWNKLATDWKVKLNQRIKSLEALRDSLTACIGCGCLSLKKCPLYNRDDRLGKEQSGPVLLNNKI